MGLYLYSPNVSSWPGAYLSIGKTLTLTLAGKIFSTNDVWEVDSTPETSCVLTVAEVVSSAQPKLVAVNRLL